MLLKALFIR